MKVTELYGIGTLMYCIVLYLSAYHTQYHSVLCIVILRRHCEVIDGATPSDNEIS